MLYEYILFIYLKRSNFYDFIIVGWNYSRFYTKKDWPDDCKTSSSFYMYVHAKCYFQWYDQLTVNQWKMTDNYLINNKRFTNLHIGDKHEKHDRTCDLQMCCHLEAPETLTNRITATLNCPVFSHLPTLMLTLLQG